MDNQQRKSIQQRHVEPWMWEIEQWSIQEAPNKQH